MEINKKPKHRTVIQSYCELKEALKVALKDALKDIKSR